MTITKYSKPDGETTIGIQVETQHGPVWRSSGVRYDANKLTTPQMVALEKENANRGFGCTLSEYIEQCEKEHSIERLRDTLIGG